MAQHPHQQPRQQHPQTTLTAVLIAPSHDTRKRLTAILVGRLGFATVVEVEGLADAYRQTGADLIIADLSAPDAADDLRWGSMRLCHPNARFAVIFDGQFNQSTRLAFAAGMPDFLRLDVTNESLASLLEEVMLGVRIVPSADFFERLQAVEPGSRAESASAAPLGSAIEKLTPRERDIVRLIAEGATNREIAAKLQLSEKTVRNRVSEILAKIGVNNRTQVALWAQQNSLTDS